MLLVISLFKRYCIAYLGANPCRVEIATSADRYQSIITTHCCDLTLGRAPPCTVHSLSCPRLAAFFQSLPSIVVTYLLIIFSLYLTARAPKKETLPNPTSAFLSASHRAAYIAIPTQPLAHANVGAFGCFWPPFLHELFQSSPISDVALSNSTLYATFAGWLLIWEGTTFHKLQLTPPSFHSLNPSFIRHVFATSSTWVANWSTLR